MGAEMRSLATLRQNQGFPKGNLPPLWHTTLLARCSVLYLLARLAGEAGGGAICTPLPSSGKQADFFVTGREQKARLCFQRAAAGIRAPVPRSPFPQNM